MHFAITLTGGIKSWLWVLALVAFTYSQAQAQTRPKAPAVPKEATTTVEALGQWLKSQYPDPTTRLTATYAWVTQNLAYDHEDAFTFSVEAKEQRAVAAQAMQTRKHVCRGIAALFEALCSQGGSQAYVVNGYARQGDLVGHAWVAVLTPAGWRLFDPTWEINRAENPTLAGLPWAYFLQKGEAFRPNHMPFDPLWQLSQSPLTYAAFDAARSRPVPPPKPGNFAFADSIEAFLQLDSLAQKEATYRRMSAQKATNYAITSYGHTLGQNIQVVKHNRFAAVYDSSVVAANAFVARYNTYIRAYNARFKQVSDSSLLGMLSKMEADLNRSQAQLKKAFALRTNPDHLETLYQTKTFLAESSQKLAEVQRFLTKYLAANKVNRLFMW